MAHPVRIGISVRSGPRTLLQRPQLAALLGVVASEWAFLENRITHLYAYLMGTYLPRTPGYHSPTHPVALQVFDTLETQRLRSDLLRKLTKWVVKDPNLITMLGDKVLPAVQKSAKLRNTLVHGHWGVSDEYPDELILMPTFGKKLVYGEADFEEAVTRIIDACRQLTDFEIKARGLLDPTP